MSSPSPKPSDGCTYVPLANYDWALLHILLGPRGRCHGVTLAFNPAVWCLAAALHACTVWMAVGLNIQIFMTFKRRNTFYFWSIFVTTWAIISVVCMWDIRFFTRAGNTEALQWAQAAFWIFESIGFSMVLISRLYLIVDRPELKILPYVVVILDMIVHSVVLAGKAGHLSHKGWRAVNYLVPIFFTVQETSISSLYVLLFVKFMRHNYYGGRTRSMFHFLVLAQLVIVCFDVAMVTINSLKYEIAKAVLTPFFYASKLKFEFMVLNRLTAFRNRNDELAYAGNDAFGPAASPESGSPGLSSADRSSTLRAVSDGAVDASKTTQHLSMSTRELPPYSPATPLEVDEISQLENQYLGRSKAGDSAQSKTDQLGRASSA